MTLEDVLVSLMLLAVGAAGTCFLFWSATEKLRVLLSCLAWTKVEAVVTSSRLLESKSTHYVSHDAPTPRGPDVEVERDPGVLGGYHLLAGPTKVTTTTVTPQVSFRFSLGDRSHVVSNLDSSWNHSVGYARGDAEDWVKHFARGTTHRLRVNPRAPREVFVGWRHFPYVWAPIQGALGFFLGVAPLVAVIKPALACVTEDEHTAAQKLMVALACASPLYAVGRAALDVLRGAPRP